MKVTHVFDRLSMLRKGGRVTKALALLTIWFGYILAVLLSGLAFSAPSAESQGDFHICYFSLNNPKEVTEMQKFTKRIKKHTHCSISVKEYLTDGDNPEESFKKMVESGVRCDGLVISGHHTGAFGGKRAFGSLGIDFLEKLSCDKKYTKWFSQIKALWLQGCRTLGTGEIVVDSAEEDADYHTRRVWAVLQEDHLEQSIADLNVEFSATLDQDNPLSSRYLRAFPGATVFGWTKIAPGEKAGSQYSIPFHMAHTARLIENQDRFPSDSPIKGTWTEESTVQYLNSMVGVLNGDAKCQELAVEAWKEHGRVQNQATEYGFYNPDLNAYKALTKTDNSILKKARVYDCLLKNSRGQKFLKILDEILKDPTLIRYTYNALLEKMKNLKTENPELYAQTISKLRGSPVVKNFLSKKLDDKSLGLLRKIDYLAFYEEIYGPTEKIIPAVLEKAHEAFVTIPSHTIDELDYKNTLLNSLAKHGYLNNDQGLKLVQQVGEDSNIDMKKLAMRVAGQIGALSILEKGTLNNHAHVRAVAMRQLGQFGEKVLPTVEKGIADSHPYVRASTMDVAGQIGKKSLPTVEKGLSDSSQWVKGSALSAALQIGEPALPLLRKTFNTPEGKETIIKWPKAIPEFKRAINKHQDPEFKNYMQTLIQYAETEQTK